MWCDAFVIQEAHVTNRDWLAFLDDLQSDGRAELAERCDTIVSVCPPGDAVAVAEQVAATGFDGLYLDANAVATT